jgi:hypothetical protein
MRLLLGMLLGAWLVCGTVAADQRDYFERGIPVNCTVASTTALTIVAGPLNYQGVDPNVTCQVPTPST